MKSERSRTDLTNGKRKIEKWLECVGCVTTVSAGERAFQLSHKYICNHNTVLTATTQMLVPQIYLQPQPNRVLTTTTEAPVQQTNTQPQPNPVPTGSTRTTQILDLQTTTQLCIHKPQPNS